MVTFLVPELCFFSSSLMILSFPALTTYSKVRFVTLSLSRLHLLCYTLNQRFLYPTQITTVSLSLPSLEELNSNNSVTQLKPEIRWSLLFTPLPCLFMALHLSLFSRNSLFLTVFIVLHTLSAPFIRPRFGKWQFDKSQSWLNSKYYQHHTAPA